MRVLGLGRALLSRMAVSFLLSLGFTSTAGCTLSALGDPPLASNPPPSSGFGGSTSGGKPGLGFGGSGEVSCEPPSTNAPVFAQQVFSSQTAFAREFYAWTTDEEALALRQDQQLFRQPAGSGPPFTFLSNQTNRSAEQIELAQALSSTFQMGRHAWPEPWTTRMGWPGRDPGGQLVRIVLKPQAWLAFAEAGALWVFDAQQQPVAPADALANQGLIGAIYFDSSFSNPDPCLSGSGGYREFLLGNLAMVQEWSVGTQLIHDRVLGNVAQLTRFLNGIRSCPITTNASEWAQSIVCSWQDERIGVGVNGAGGFGAAGASGFGEPSAGTAGFGGTPVSGPTASGTEQSAYEQALAIPNPNYLPAPMQIATMIETLQGDLFEPDPLVVTPGSP
jgi:hypothetical protein